MDELLVGGSATAVVTILTFVVRAHVSPLKVRLAAIEKQVTALGGLPERVASLEATIKERKQVQG